MKQRKQQARSSWANPREHFTSSRAVQIDRATRWHGPRDRPPHSSSVRPARTGQADLSVMLFCNDEERTMRLGAVANPAWRGRRMTPIPHAPELVCPGCVRRGSLDVQRYSLPFPLFVVPVRYTLIVNHICAATFCCPIRPDCVVFLCLSSMSSMSATTACLVPLR
jgi:hypothetical protein